MKKLLALAVCFVLCFPAIAPTTTGTAPASTDGPTKYILVAGKWGSDQSAAVAAAGGQVVFQHAETGVGIASSYAADFAQRAVASNAFTQVGEDLVLELEIPSVPEGLSAVTPGDEPLFAAQWHHTAIESPAAWAAGYTGRGVRVAILDGGVDSRQPDLAPNLDIGASTSFVPGFQFDQDTGFLLIGILMWHGTHVAGIVAAADNNVGTIGVAPEATIIAVKVADGVTVNFSALLQGLYYAATTARADIINLSLGRLRQKQGQDVAAQMTAIHRAITFAERKGALVVASAGNSAIDLDHSKNFSELVLEAPGVVGVSATAPIDFALGATNFRRFATYSNFGHSVVDLAAPGGQFTFRPAPIPVIAADGVMSTNTLTSTQPWFWLSGTSMAAPMVSGVAALIKSRDPSLTPAQIRAKLMQTADDEAKPGHDAQYGSGFVNARRAVNE